MPVERPVNPYHLKSFEDVTPTDVIEYLRQRETTTFDPYDRGINRNGAEYIEILLGLSSLFDYARSLPSHGVLDIGAGLTRGTRDLQQSQMGEGLQFTATVLTRRQEIQQNLGYEQVIVTPVETLDRIENESRAVVLGANSIGYSIDPESAITQIDRVLIPGGVLKATFMESIFAPRPTDMGPLPKMYDHFGYSAVLIYLGYDLIVLPPDTYRGFDVLLAVKSGGTDKKVTAEDLMLQDYATFREQIEELGGTPPPDLDDFF